MKRSIQIDRLYTLGNYTNIKFIESISDIDEELALDEEFMKKLYTSLMVACDMNYLKYLKLQEMHEKGKYTREELIDILSEQHSKLETELANYKEEENEND